MDFLIGITLEISNGGPSSGPASDYIHSMYLVRQANARVQLQV